MHFCGGCIGQLISNGLQDGLLPNYFGPLFSDSQVNCDKAGYWSEDYTWPFFVFLSYDVVTSL